MLIAIWAAASAGSGYFWPIWPIITWGPAVLLQGYFTYGRPPHAEGARPRGWVFGRAAAPRPPRRGPALPPTCPLGPPPARPRRPPQHQTDGAPVHRRVVTGRSAAATRAIVAGGRGVHGR